jgi:hypothetical protein
VFIDEGRDWRRDGGYNGLYVLSQLVLFIWLVRKQPERVKKSSIAGLILLSLLAGCAPRSKELRYYMFWMIWLVSMNLCLLWHTDIAPRYREYAKGWLLLMFVIVLGVTGGQYLWPQQRSQAELFKAIQQQVHAYTYVPGHFHSKWVKLAQARGKICVVRQQPFTFFYTSYFHMGASYQVVSRYAWRDCPIGMLAPRHKEP